MIALLPETAIIRLTDNVAVLTILTASGALEVDKFFQSIIESSIILGSQIIGREKEYFLAMIDLWERVVDATNGEEKMACCHRNRPYSRRGRVRYRQAIERVTSSIAVLCAVLGSGRRSSPTELTPRYGNAWQAWKRLSMEEAFSAHATQPRIFMIEDTSRSTWALTNMTSW